MDVEKRGVNYGLGVVLALALVLSLGAAAEGLRLPGIFADHAVLQQQMDLPVWGWGQAGETVTAAIAGKQGETTVNAEGRWRLELPPLEAGGPHTLTITSGDETLRFEDVLIGEVWLASGQSNMEWSIKNTLRYEETMKSCANDAIRFTQMDRTHSPLPQEELPGHTPWTTCTAESLNSCHNNEGFSAVSYYFAKYLQAALGVPVGMIATAWGGTRIEPWTPPCGFEAVPALSGIVDQIERNTPGSASFKARLSQQIEGVKAWLPQAEAAFENNAFLPALAGVAGGSELNDHGKPTTLYNAMVHPIAPYANRGFLWYQGESNRGEGMAYRDKMEALIEGWRKVFNNPELACYFVQLAPFDYGSNPTALAEIWEAQIATLDLPGTGMAMTNDIGNIKDIHPRNKDDVGKRLANLALNKTYGQKEVVCDSPLFDRFEVDGAALRVFFKNAKALKTRDGAAPNWFYISGPDGIYREAEGVIDGVSVVLKAAGVSVPVAVRFAWDHCAEPNLTNEVGLPASAFRAGEIPVDGVLRSCVPEATGFDVVYACNPVNLPIQDGKAVYEADNHSAFKDAKIERIAYFLYLVDTADQVSWVYAEMDPFTQNTRFLGVPERSKLATFQEDLKGLVVKSNVAGVPTGAIEHGAIEAWAYNYGTTAARGLPGASNDTYDFDDSLHTDANPGHGCLQIHDVKAGVTILAFNNHRAGLDAAVGIGNAPGEHKDWTFSKNAKAYRHGQLLVLVKTAQ